MSTSVSSFAVSPCHSSLCLLSFVGRILGMLCLGWWLGALPAEAEEAAAPHVSYVEAVRARTESSPLYLWKNGEGNIPSYFSIFQRHGHRTRSYELRRAKDAASFYALKSVFVGNNLPTLTGNWITTKNLVSTMEPGSTFSGQAEVAEAIDLKVYADSRGGLWSISIDGGVPAIVSSWSPVAGPKSLRIATGLARGPHVVVGKFLGADPAHPPTGGAACGRLFYKSTDPGTLPIFVSQEAPAWGEANLAFDPVHGVWNMGFQSNKEFAFVIRQAVQPAKEDSLVPDHGDKITTVAVDPMRLWLDGDEVSLSQMYRQEMRLARSRIEVQQHFYGRNIFLPEKNLVEIVVTHVFLADGVVEIRGWMRALEDIAITKGYALMLPFPKRQGQKLYSSTGGVYPSEIDDGKNTLLTHGESGVAASYGVVAVEAPEIVCALDVCNPKETLRTGCMDRGSAFFQSRAEDQGQLRKLYDPVFSHHPMKAGETYAWSGRYVVAEIPDASSLPARVAPGGIPPPEGSSVALPRELKFSAAMGRQKLKVSANGPFAVLVSGAGFSVPVAHGRGEQEIEIVAAANPGLARTGRLIVVSGTAQAVCSLTQAGLESRVPAKAE